MALSQDNCWQEKHSPVPMKDPKIINPVHLHGLQQALYILRRIMAGESEQDITINEFNGDEQIVKIWIQFLLDVHLLECKDGSWVLTDKGAPFIR